MLKIIITFVLLVTDALASEDQSMEKNIDSIIKEFIMNNPEIIIKSLEKHREKIEATTEKIVKNNIVKYYSEKTFAQHPSLGSKDSKIILTEFIDYNCSFCKKTLKTILQLHDTVEDLQIVFLDYPILSDSSDIAAMAALAANEQNNYFDYHSALLKHRGEITEDVLMDIAEKLKLDLVLFKRDMYSSKIKDKLKDNINLARSLQVRGTPSFLLGDNILSGAYSYENFLEIIERSKGK